jgi:hypothetical protein
VVAETVGLVARFGSDLASAFEMATTRRVRNTTSDQIQSPSPISTLAPVIIVE